MSNWLNQILGNVADIKLSNVDKKKIDGESEVKLCNYTDVYKNTIINNEKATSFMIASCSKTEYDRFVLRKGQVALTKDSEKKDDIGISAYIAEDLDNVVLGYHLALITPDEKKLNGRFLNYWLNTSQAKKYFENNASGSGQRFTLPIDIIKGMKLFIPDLSTPKKIASVLSALDDKIELNNKINAELEAMAKTLYDYWFVQFEFPFDFAQGKPNAEGKPYKSSGGKLIYNETLKREIPEGWEVKRLELLGNFKNGVNYDPSKPGLIPCPIINVRNISNSSFFIRNDDLDVIYLNENDVNKYAVNEDSIIIARSGIPGATRLINNHSPNTLFCGFAIHYQLENTKLRNYIFFFLKSIEENINKGSGGTIMKNVNQATLNNLKMTIPPIDIIQKFNETIDSIFQKILNIEKQNQELAALRDWLLPMLMNGQVKVEEGIMYA